MVTDLTRRRLLQAGLIGLVPPTVMPEVLAKPLEHNTSAKEKLLFANSDMQPALIGCALNSANSYSVIVANRIGAPIHKIPLPDRGHGLAVSPSKIRPHAIAFARRPGNYFQPINYITGQKYPIITATHNRHFYGHGAYSTDGKLLFATEGERTTSRGIVGVYDVTDRYNKIDELTGFGIGPHELKVINQDTLCIAVGGVHTNGRKPLNLDTMVPCLVYMDVNGNILQRAKLSDPKLSIRHLSLVSANTIACGQQYRGEIENYPSLIALHAFDTSAKNRLIPLHAEPEQWARFNGYIASIAAVGDHLLATSPRGNCYGIWSISTNRLLELQHLPDASGVVALNNEFKVSSGVGKVISTDPAASSSSYQNYSNISWDNHWLKLIP